MADLFHSNESRSKQRNLLVLTHTTAAVSISSPLIGLIDDGWLDSTSVPCSYDLLGVGGNRRPLINSRSLASVSSWVLRYDNIAGFSIRDRAGIHGEQTFLKSLLWRQLWAHQL